jgi:hypothetical protein
MVTGLLLPFKRDGGTFSGACRLIIVLPGRRDSYIDGDLAEIYAN